MLTNIITGAISQMPDVVVAGHVARQEDVASEIHLNAVDAIIVQTREPGATANFRPLRPYCVRFAEFSAASLQSALRAPSAPIRRVRRL